MQVCFPHEQEGFLHLFLYMACCGQKHTHVPAPRQSKVTLLTSHLGGVLQSMECTTWMCTALGVLLEECCFCCCASKWAWWIAVVWWGSPSVFLEGNRGLMIIPRHVLLRDSAYVIYNFYPWNRRYLQNWEFLLLSPVAIFSPRILLLFHLVSHRTSLGLLGKLVLMMLFMDWTLEGANAMGAEIVSAN